MSQLPCWPGALAYITYTDIPENRGRLVQVLRLDDPDDDGGAVCLVKPVDGNFARCAIYLDGRLVGTHKCSRGCLRDDCLRPITPPPCAEDITTDVPADAVSA